MKKTILTPIIVLIGALIFNLLFWHEKQGLNVFLFDIFIIAALWLMDKEPFSTPSVKWTVAGTLSAAMLIVWHNSLLVKYIHVFSFASMVGLMQERELRFIGFAIMQYIFNLFETPIAAFRVLKTLPLLRGQKNAAKHLNSAWMTIFILPIFYLIYYTANAKFAELSNQFWHNIFQFLSFDININRILFVIFGFFIVGAAFWQQKWVDFAGKDASYPETLVRMEIQESDLSLYRNALNLIIALNILLFINNLIDVQYVWFADVSGKTALQLKEYVHEGTYILIFGIVLAISVILWLFKNSLNFLENTPKTRHILRGVTTVWLIQNAVLAVSVGIRNAQYINFYGLAYKRIGVFVFLALTLYGLWLLFMKIKQKRTFFFFMRRGAYAIYAVLLATCFVNWDVFITRYNIQIPSKSGAIDVRFLVEDVSSKNLYLLFENVEQLAPKMTMKPFPENDYSRQTEMQFSNDAERLTFLKNILQYKKTVFEEEQKNLSWLSWNHADDVNKAFFKYQ